jgi:hypothetical protein
MVEQGFGNDRQLRERYHYRERPGIGEARRRQGDKRLAGEDSSTRRRGVGRPS